MEEIQNEVIETLVEEKKEEVVTPDEVSQEPVEIPAESVEVPSANEEPGI